MTSSSTSLAPDPLAHLQWLIPELIPRSGVAILGGDAKSGKSRLLAYLVANMLPQPQGGPVIFTDNNELVVLHSGVRRILWLAGDERVNEVMARTNAFARAQGIEPRADWPISFIQAVGMQLDRAEDRAAFEQLYIAPGKFDVLIIDPLCRVHWGSDADMLHHLRWWSKQYGLAIIAADSGGDLARAAGSEEVRLTLERTHSPTPCKCRLDRHQNGRMVLSLRLLDLGDPQGFRVAADGVASAA